MPAWSLPEAIADILPAEARRIETLRRSLLDQFAGFGYELVMPPMLEYVESLLSGTGRDLDLQMFKLVDQMSGRTMGLRADITPQVARIDAHMLNRRGVTRRCYCGPVLHALPAGAHASREPLQFGAEIYGHAGLEADLEVLDLALDCLRGAGVAQSTLDLGDARIVRGVLAGVMVGTEHLAAVHAALAAKDGAELRDLSRGFAAEPRNALRALLALYGDAQVLDAARRELPQRPLIQAALDDLQRLARQVAASHHEVTVGFDLADSGGNDYYSGARFAVYVEGSPDAVARGGRYDEVGAVFGRSRPAVGFSLDVKVLAACVPAAALHAAIRAPWLDDGSDDGLRASVRALRERGETVVRALPGHGQEAQEFACDRELARDRGVWSVRAL